jgi:PAS domain S-box-containing protein
VLQSFFKKITEAGVDEADSFADRKPVVVSNYIALILIAVNFLLLVLIPGNWNGSALSETCTAAVIFSVPILLNHFKMHSISKLYLCWCPPLLYTWYMLVFMQDSKVISLATFDGLRFYLLAYSCIPYLLLERRNFLLLIVGIIPGLVCLLFSDLIIEFLGMQIGFDGIVIQNVDLSSIRSLVSYLVINASCLSLKIVIEKGDLLNQKLVNDLKQKNQIIEEKAQRDVSKLHEQLRFNLQQVSEREFIINQSERIAKVASWEYRGENKRLLLSKEMYNILGIEASHIPDRRDFYQLLGEEQTNILVAQTKALLTTGRPYELTLRVRTPLGHAKWIRLYAFTIQDESGIIGARGVGHDITLYKEAEELLRTNEQKYRSLFEQASDAIMIIDEKGKFIEVNASMCSLVGFTKDELAVMNIGELVHPEDLAAAPLGFDRLVKGEQIKNERRVLHKDGTVMYVESNVKMFSENKFIVISRNVTERKRDQEKLQLSQANLHATINNTEILIWSVDRNLNVIMFNQPFYDYMKENYNVTLRSGRRILANNQLGDDESISKKWERNYMRALSGEVLSLEETLNGRDLHYSLSPIVEGNKIIGVSIFGENVTERVRHDRELAKANRKFAEMKLMALRSLMNPHFIFNILNSIQFYIAKNDRVNAINYLSTFSKLVRTVLTHSINNKIKLSDEVDLLNNYIHLELTRFESKFDFILEISPELNPDDIEIPSLLIQPYVENAILHGLYNKKDRGKLWIRILDAGESIVVEVEDNGVGREAATRIKQQSFPSHNSMGIKLTEERLLLINQHQNTSVNIIDKHDENGPAGTKVVVRIEY